MNYHSITFIALFLLRNIYPICISVFLWTCRGRGNSAMSERKFFFCMSPSLRSSRPWDCTASQSLENNFRPCFYLSATSSIIWICDSAFQEGSCDIVLLPLWQQELYISYKTLKPTRNMWKTRESPRSWYSHLFLNDSHYIDTVLSLLAFSLHFNILIIYSIQ